MKRILCVLSVGIFFFCTLAQANLLFQVTSSGQATAVKSILCLNAKAPASCQHYDFTAQNVQIKSTLNHQYPAAGIKLLNSGYRVEGCVPYPNGYCLFSVSSTAGVSLQITPTPFTVTPRGDGNESISPSVAQMVDLDGTQTFIVTANASYVLSASVGGDCPLGSWSGDTYTTGPVTSNCSVVFSSVLASNTYTVTPQGDGHEVISPSSVQTLNAGFTQTFIVTANAGYVLSTSVGGNCPQGSWSGATYTTGPVTSNCSVVFSSVLASNTYTVTPQGDGHEVISPSSVQTLNAGFTQTFTVTANASYVLSTSVGGNCPQGSWSGANYTTGPVTSNCSVVFSSVLASNTYTVTPQGDGHEVISPSSVQTLNAGFTQTFTVTANAGYVLSASVGGDCPQGSWSGATYTTGPVTSNCSVVFSSVLASNTYTVTPRGDGHEVISPSSVQTLNAGFTQTFIVTANAGYVLSTSVGGNCPQGSWSGATYTTGPVTSNCSVVFSSVLASNTYTVTPQGDGHEVISPSSVQTLNAGFTQTFTVTGNAGYVLSTSVGGNCPQGSWSGDTYTTGSVTSNCSVVFSSVLASNAYTVRPQGDGHEVISPSSVQTLNAGFTQTFTVTANASYVLSTSVGGNCPQGSWSGANYTTGPVTSNCSVVFSSVLASNTYTVRSQGDGHEVISPSSVQTLNAGFTQTFTVTANAGYVLSTSVGGNCPQGSWSGATYTTGPVTSNCSVVFSSVLASNTYTVTPQGDGHEVISPSSVQTLNAGFTQTFTVTANAGYVLSTSVGGNCPQGSWSGANYTTGSVTSNCSVVFYSVLASNTYTVRPRGDGHEVISPSSLQMLNAGSTQAFTVTANAGYVLSTSVGGDCPQGSWSGANNYTTGAITSNCAVVFSIAPKSNQAITFTTTAPSNAVVAGSEYDATAIASSGLPVALAIDASSSQVCAILDGPSPGTTTITIAFNGAGTCTINANQAGNSNYNAAPQEQQSFTVGRGDQIVTFTSQFPPAVTVGSTFTATAASNQLLPVTITVDARSTSICSISGNTVTATAAGACILNANQPGNANYMPASAQATVNIIAAHHKLSLSRALRQAMQWW